MLTILILVSGYAGIRLVFVDLAVETNIDTQKWKRAPFISTLTDYDVYSNMSDTKHNNT